MEKSTLVLIVSFVGGIILTLFGTKLGIGKSILDNFKAQLKDKDVSATQAVNEEKISALAAAEAEVKRSLDNLEKQEKAASIKEAEAFWKDKH